MTVGIKSSLLTWRVEGSGAPSFIQEKYMGLSPDDTPHSTCTELPSVSSDENMNGDILGGSERGH